MNINVKNGKIKTWNGVKKEKFIISWLTFNRYLFIILQNFTLSIKIFKTNPAFIGIL